METQVVKTDDISTYKSPQRMLVRFFRCSRDNWKQKYMDIKAQIKRFKNQAADARRSREQWKTKAESFQAKFHRLEAELAALQARQQAAEADKKLR